MNNNFIPEKQGLYDPRFEHDACGIGVATNIDGVPSNKIIIEALEILNNLEHRGAKGADEDTGDGAGILLQIPHSFFKRECSLKGIDLPLQGRYAVGMLFLNPEEDIRKKSEKQFEEIIKNSKMSILGWRDVPINKNVLGHGSLKSMPYIRQIFIKKSDAVKTPQDFERELYIVRKRAEKEIRHGESNHQDGFFYVASLSCNTIVYKGMLTAEQVSTFFLDLQDATMETAIALVHSRFSTNTFPSWERAHPNRYIIHNGEINTIRGNVNNMKAREATFESDFYGERLKDVLPVIDEDGSDSAMFDNCLEFMVLSGKSLQQSVMTMVPEPWEKNKSIPKNKRDFYEYSSCLMEPWDGPAAVVATDGKTVVAALDRNGLRPARYYVTKDRMLILASEVGVLDIEPSKVVVKDRLKPGMMLVVDTEEKNIIKDCDVKNSICTKNPYRQWLDSHLIDIESLEDGKKEEKFNNSLLDMQKEFGYTFEDLNKIIIPMIQKGVEPIGAMGNDTPLAMLSEKPQLLYNYFKQLFAQVTNPPIDAIREEIVVGTRMYLGSMGNILEEKPECCNLIKLDDPFLDNKQMGKIKSLKSGKFKVKEISILFKNSIQERIEEIFSEAEEAINSGVNIIVLSDKKVSKDKPAIPALLVVSGLHHYLIRKGIRTKASLVLESGEPREVHHFATLIGYGMDAVNPYLIHETIKDIIDKGLVKDIDFNTATKNYYKACVKGVIKVLSKMGISTIQSYKGAQIFEALGLSNEVIDKYFTGTPSKLGGIGLDIIEEEKIKMHKNAFEEENELGVLDSGGNFQWRKDGEYHLINPKTIVKLQEACREGNYEIFKDYCDEVNGPESTKATIRQLFKFKKLHDPITIDEVEPVENIVKRFKTGAMSFGSISKEAHECLAIAMNRLGGKSNSGEGGEYEYRFSPDKSGDSRCSAIKQVASGRFGVTNNYLSSAKEIQIKIAQGAKPGEGGQLPGEKVYPWVAQVRNSTPGVGLISPPPHHDIYSIEDLAELIHDLKCANPRADINVKLVSEVGVGTIAAGVAKGLADVILISGYDGGTGAAPRTSIRHTGLPWELGLAETHQTLVLNKLRNRVKLETDGKLMTGKDIAIAAILGAEEFGFATLPLVTLGCVMMRVCNLDTCPVGVATQNPELRKKFTGKPDYVINFMRFMAQHLREIMADLGIRTIDELVGRTDLIEFDSKAQNPKAKTLDLNPIIYKPEGYESLGPKTKQNHKLDQVLDTKVLLNICRPAIIKNQKVEATLRINNTDRAIGAILGNRIAGELGSNGLEEDTIKINFKGSAGQSFGAFVPKGVTFTLEGDTNDYIGKGFSGGKIIVYPPRESDFDESKNIIIGNVSFYGAVGGEAYINGIGGERFCVRNSGVHAVVEGVGDHGCEYMTGGKVIVLGKTGVNFAAGMTGGIAYVFDEDGDFDTVCNSTMVHLEREISQEDLNDIKQSIEKHVKYTDSLKGRRILKYWDNLKDIFVKVIPKDYKRMMEAIEAAKLKGMSEEEARMAAFNENKNDIGRKTGN